MRIGNDVDLKKIRPAIIDGKADAVKGHGTLGNDLHPIFLGKGKPTAQGLARAVTLRTVARQSTCPLTRCPPSRSPRASARSMFTLSPVLSLPSVVRERVSVEA